MSLVLCIYLKTISFNQLGNEKYDEAGKSFSLLNDSLPFKINKFSIEEKDRHLLH